MRYLVKARAQARIQERPLQQAVADGALGRGSIAGDEYIYDLEQARVGDDWHRALGENLLLRHATGRGTALLGKIF